jgi:hypothetical protein
MAKIFTQKGILAGNAQLTGLQVSPLQAYWVWTRVSVLRDEDYP